MADKRDLRAWVLEAVDALGACTAVEVSEWVWFHREHELRSSGSLFYTWQYDLRWAAQSLRNEGVLAPVARGQNSRWRRA